MEFSPTNSAREEKVHDHVMSHSGTTAQRKEEKNRMKELSTKLLSLKTLVVLVLVIQVVIALFILPFSPLYIFRQETLASQIVGEVSRLTAVNVNEQPEVAVVADPEVLRDANSIQAQVYKDAQKGDYIVAYSDKMLIYRRNENKLVYEGDTPAALATKSEEALVTAILSKAKDAGLIAQDSTETPQLSAVTDASLVKNQDPTFYANVANEDIIALFPTAKVIVLFRPSTGNMVNSGSFNTSISAR